MKNIFSKLVLVAFLFSMTAGTAVARECTLCKKTSVKKTSVTSKAAVCKRAQSTSELNINNVRALINGYGNMWFDGSVTQYYLPKNSTSTPLYCAALWIGGTDVNDQLRIAALRFGSEGDDYWPGPLTIDGKADVSLEVCNYYDRHFKITQAEVQTFRSMFDYTETGVVPNASYDEGAIPKIIKEWPAHSAFDNESYYLAPFCDVDGDGVYNYQAGDYPYYDFNNALCPRTLKAALAPGQSYVPKPTMEDSAGIVKGGLLSDQVLKGDQTIWWVFNDMGNVHTESGGNPIGMEIRAQAFAFATNDEINNMTFYSYEIINRSTYELRNTYFSQWVDPDLGYAADDYIGCDVKRGLGYCYNGKETDGPGTGAYSGVPPAVGIDFFQGPYMDPDGKDNPKIDIEKMRLYFPDALKTYAITSASGNVKYDTIALTDDADLYYPNAWYFKPGDSVGNCAINGVNFGNNIIDDERFGMRRFIYYENSASGANAEPQKATDYYNYLQGRWRTGQKMLFGGNGLNTGVDPAKIPADFMFPGDSDPLHWGTNGVVPTSHPDDWTEVVAGNQPGDRRFMQSAGPFTLKPGALNYITVGIPFAQATSGSAWTSVELLREIDDVCQSLFENCFKVLDGPQAPTMVAQELSNEVILYLTYENPKGNNYGESYDEVDPSIVRGYVDANGTQHTYTDAERSYKFEGYQIYQLANAKASVADINDETKARLVAQCDVENYYDTNNTLPIGTLVNYTSNSTTGLLTGQIMVTGSNRGIKHVFHITNDAFASGTNTKLVNNKEYYFIAIAYAHNRYKEYSQTDAAFLDGQKEPYLAGRQNEYGGAIEKITVKPHDPTSENGGTVVQASFGMSPNVTRIEGYGNGGTILELTEESIEELMGAKGVPGMAPGTFTDRTTVSYSSEMKNPCIIPQPRYKQNAGPVNVRVVDPLNINPGKFYIRFNGANDTSRWTISRVDGTALYQTADGSSVFTDTADFVISRYNEQLFLNLGIAVAITNPSPIASRMYFNASKNYTPGCHAGLVNADALLYSSMKFSDSTKMWLTGIRDDDSYLMYNWIHSGSQFASGNVTSFLNTSVINKPITGQEMLLDDDYYRDSIITGTSTQHFTFPLDKYGVFEDVIGGTWAPYGLTSVREYHPAFSYVYYLTDSVILDSVYKADKHNPKLYGSYYKAQREALNPFNNKSLTYNDMSLLPSVRIVITSDTSKWTRCPVIEMCDDYTQSEGNARRFQMRRHLSVNKMGKTIEDLGIAANTADPSNPAYIAAYGMGWFPGYAISLETGERLNVLFGEDSRYSQYNGRDMMWNPVSTIMNGTQNYVMGGRHYIYVMNATSQWFPRYHNNFGAPVKYSSPSYDAGRWASMMLRSLDHLMTTTSDYFNHGILSRANDTWNSNSAVRDSAAAFYSFMSWVNMPLTRANFQFTNPIDIPTDVVININLNGRYGTNWSKNGTNPANRSMALINNNNPLYMFELTNDIATLTGQATRNNAAQEFKDSILSLIGVVPNPYYSYSSYETSSQLETRVRFINVPAGSTISIYTVDGTLVRRLGPSPSNTTTVDWDLHNHNGLPIAGGMYLVHFECPGIGEAVVKWFGTMRPVDLNSFKF
ncbi:MAG: hypothetical protein SPJ13_05635 [Bacteroidales bacterium]|nr:hypothetical protein [Bacteroidales bacterium]